jgi:acyl carrier protein
MDTNQTSLLNKQIQELLGNALQIPAEEVTDDLQFGDIPQWDSMGHMEVMISLEEAFGIEITAETIADLTSFTAIYQFIQENSHDQS